MAAKEANVLQSLARNEERERTGKMSHDARAVANVMIERGIEDGNPLTPLQIIKLTYLCQAWMLAMYNRPMFRQQVEAWEYGPVIADVYHILKDNKRFPVNYPMPSFTQKFDEEEEHILNEVFRVYGDWSGGQLSRLTHQPGSPWYKTRQEDPLRRHLPIDNERIREYYAAILSESEKASST